MLCPGSPGRVSHTTRANVIVGSCWRCFRLILGQEEEGSQRSQAGEGTEDLSFEELLEGVWLLSL